MHSVLGVEVRAQLDVAKSKVECWSILIIAAALVIHGDPSCSIGSILGYQFMQLVAEFLTDVVCLKRKQRADAHAPLFGFTAAVVPVVLNLQGG